MRDPNEQNRSDKKKRNFIYFTQNMNYDLYRFDIF